MKRMLFHSSFFFLLCFATGALGIERVGAPNPPSTKPPIGGIQGLGNPNVRRMGRRIASRSEVKIRRAYWFLGPLANFDGPLAKVSSGDTLSRGKGFGGGIGISYRDPFLRFSFQPAFRTMSIGRKLGANDYLVDPSPVDFTQKVNYLGLGGWSSLLVEEGGKPGAFEPAWWVELGTELLIPMGQGVQTNSLNEEIKFQAEKLWFVLLGSTVDFETPRGDLLKMGLHLFYNIPGNSKARLFGVRAQIAFDFGLM